MWNRTYLRVFLIFIWIEVYLSANEFRDPTVLISFISRNEEHSLPVFLGYIEKLNYPTKRISVLIQTDHNEDNTHQLYLKWKDNVQHNYHSIKILHSANPKYFNDAQGPNEWTRLRYYNILQLRQTALDEARKQWADYIMYIDNDNFLLNPETLNILIDQERVVVAPMLRLFETKSGYSNFWGGIGEDGYYKRVPEYFQILKWELVGTFTVPMVHSTFLIDLRYESTENLQFYPIPDTYSWQIDDIMVFAHSAKEAGIDLNICNVQAFGYMMETFDADASLQDRKIIFTDTLIDYMAYNEPLIRSDNVPFTYPEQSYHGFDEIFMINLVRRPDRRIRMERSLKELGIKWKHFPAVDGKNFTREKVTEMGVVAMSDFKDPYLQRPLTFGEIGCFMSHWYIWQEMVERELETVLVLEDDVRFEYNFVHKMNEVMRQAKEISKELQWDLIYFGRKHMSKVKEDFVHNSNNIVWAKYSYWTLGYVLQLSGAKKLIAGNPLPKMVPVDEYIPIMFDHHPVTALKERFSPHNLIGFSAEPLLMYPTHYVGDTGYVSDTEDTLSFQGESVEVFRQLKEKEKSKANKQSPKMQADEIKPKEESVTSINKLSHHGEL